MRGINGRKARPAGLALGFTAATFLIPTAAMAGQWAYGVGYVGEHSSNIRRASSGSEDEWINSAIAGFAYHDASDDLSANVSGQVEFRNYAHETFPDETLASLDSAVVWAIKPRRFTWTLLDSFRQVTLDSTQPDIPTNRAGSNALSTGPDFYIPFGARQTLSIGARYGNVYVGDTVLDNDRYSAAVRWLFQSSPISLWSANYEHQEVHFDDEVQNENFKRDDAYVRYERRRPQSRFSADIGHTNIERARSPSVDGTLARMEWREEISSDSSVELTLSSAYQDIGSELLGYVTGPTPGGSVAAATIATDIISNDIFYNRQALLSYNRRASHTGLMLRGVVRDVDFEVMPDDRKENGGRVEVSYFHSPLTTMSVFADYLRVDYEQQDREDSERVTGARLQYRLSAQVSIGLDVSRNERESTVSTESYVERRALFMFGYSTGPLYSPPSRR